MKVCGIIVEYNPLHNGHLYHIQQAKQHTKADVLVAVMSGNFVQRGEFAIVDKWQRTQAALDAGVDLVLELPTIFTLQSATQFGKAGIDILHRAQCDYVVFGSETGNLEELKEIAELPFSIDNFKQNMKKGYSYPASYGYMADSYGPNDILAISYLKEMQQFPQMTPIAIKRTSDYLSDEFTTALPSALAIRTALNNNEDVSNYTPMKNLQKYPKVQWSMYYGVIRNLLLTTPKQQLSQFFLMDEGIENHLIKQAYHYFNWEDFIQHSITKRYTKSRIQRTLCHLLLNNTKEMVKNLPEYQQLRVLGFNETGKKYLKHLKKQDVEIANHFTANLKPYRDIEYKAAVAYSMFMDDIHRQYVCQAEISGLHTPQV